MSDHERKGDAIVARIEQKLDDHIERVKLAKLEASAWQRAHIEWCKSEISRIDNEISPLMKAFNTVERPIKWVGWTVTIFITGSLLWFGQRIAAWASQHWIP